jgi:cob(I)alamin adenosyltransferase
MTRGMRLYTKTGDDGTTGLFGGVRVNKDSERVETYGTVDELNAVLGLVRASGAPAEMDELLEAIQNDLFAVGAEIACAPGKEVRLGCDPVGDGRIAALEQAIDRAEEALPALKNFVLPGGSPSAAALHHARTVCRRAERLLVRTSRSGSVRNELVIYLNRLSDLLFALARRANQLAGLPDVPWRPRQERAESEARS